MENKNLPKCCSSKNKSARNGFLKGLIYGTIPHIGCIGFIIFSLLGVTVLSSVFRTFMLKASFFYIMIVLSLIFATFSAFLYLRKRGGISKIGQHKKYLIILYGTTIGISLILYFFIFPLVTGMSIENSTNPIPSSEQLYVKVNIPCSGHAPLIIDELKKIRGVDTIEFEAPNKFRIYYDPTIANKEKILSAEIFKEYPVTVIK